MKWKGLNIYDGLKNMYTVSTLGNVKKWKKRDCTIQKSGDD